MMILAWMLYAQLVAVVVAVGAWGLDGVLRLAGASRRWVWALGLAVLVGLVATAPLRLGGRSPEVMQATRAARATTTVVAPAGAAARWTAALLSQLQEATGLLLGRVAGALRDAWGARGMAVATGGWALLSLLVLAAFAGAALRHRAVRRRSPRAWLRGVEVRLAPAMGPLVTGLLRPEIVVPRWLLEVEPGQQSLILAHEVEHRRTRDPLLLALGSAAVVLLPWNPVVWWLAARLRLAVELDCDARVMRAGAEPLAYGTLLIHIAGRPAGLALGVTALAGSRSNLKRRLMAMTPDKRRFPLLRGGVLAALAVLAILAACEADMPTSDQVAKLDASSAEVSAKRLQIISADNKNTDFYVDGAHTSADRARTIPANRIDAIQALKRRVADENSSVPEAQAVRSEVRILTKDASPAVRAAFQPNTPPTRTLALGSGVKFRVKPDFSVAEGQPLVFINGVRADEGIVRELNQNPGAIASVDVLKGEAAVKQYGEAAAAGVIRIKTKQ